MNQRKQDDTIRFIQKIFYHYLHNSSNILDLGCADGNYHQYFQNHNFTGIDIEDYPFIINHNLEQFPYPVNEMFDCILALESLQFIHYPEAILQYIFQHHLKEGGYFIATVPNINHLDDKLNNIPTQTYNPVLKQKTQNRWHPQHIRYFDVESLIQLFEYCGYEVPNVGGTNWFASYRYSELLGDAGRDGYDPLDLCEYLRKPFTQYAPNLLILARKPEKSKPKPIKNDYSKLEKFVYFAGYERSAHTLVSEILNAHENCAISQELSVSAKIHPNGPYTTKESLFDFIIDDTVKGATERKGHWANYDYYLPNQYQGTYTDLKVIGDKQWPIVTDLMMQDKYSIKELEEFTNLPVYIIHVIRNPYDNIRSLLKMKFGEVGTNLDEATEYYSNKFSFIVNELGKQYPIIHILLDKLCNNPEEQLTRLCNFLDLPIGEDYIKDCSDLIFEKPKKQDHKEEFSQESIEIIENINKTIEKIT